MWIIALALAAFTDATLLSLLRVIGGSGVLYAWTLSLCSGPGSVKLLRISTHWHAVNVGKSLHFAGS
jgi:hypothetical protein